MLVPTVTPLQHHVNRVHLGRSLRILELLRVHLVELGFLTIR